MTTRDPFIDFGLSGVECDKCREHPGVLLRVDADGTLYARECPCMAVRRAKRSIRKSGMEDLVNRCSFDTYRASDSARRDVKEMAERYALQGEGWFFIAGQSGSGKTHICAAICRAMIEQGTEVLFMPWRDVSTSLKAGVNDKDWYKSETAPFKKTPVLYIDDLFKGGATGPDIKLAFEILNYRYNDTKLRTVISSELSIEQILDLDEAIGGRIVERAKGFLLKAPEKNWRLQ